MSTKVSSEKEAEQLLAEVHSALDAFKQVSELAVAFWIEQHRAGAENNNDPRLNDCLLEINKAAKQLVRSTWAARTSFDATEASRASYLPLMTLAELQGYQDSSGHPHGPKGQADTHEAHSPEQENGIGSKVSSSHKERHGQVGQIAQKFEIEAQQALKHHAEESAAKQKVLTRTFSYKERTGLLGTHNPAKTETTSLPSKGPSTSPKTSPVAPAAKKSPSATVPAAASKRPTEAPSTVKKTSSVASTTDTKKRVPSSPANTKAKLPASPTTALKSLTSKTSSSATKSHSSTHSDTTTKQSHRLHKPESPVQSAPLKKAHSPKPEHETPLLESPKKEPVAIVVPTEAAISQPEVVAPIQELPSDDKAMPALNNGPTDNSQLNELTVEEQPAEEPSAVTAPQEEQAVLAVHPDSTVEASPAPSTLEHSPSLREFVVHTPIEGESILTNDSEHASGVAEPAFLAAEQTDRADVAVEEQSPHAVAASTVTQTDQSDQAIATAEDEVQPEIVAALVESASAPAPAEANGDIAPIRENSLSDVRAHDEHQVTPRDTGSASSSDGEAPAASSLEIPQDTIPVDKIPKEVVSPVKRKKSSAASGSPKPKKATSTRAEPKQDTSSPASSTKKKRNSSSSDSDPDGVTKQKKKKSTDHLPPISELESGSHSKKKDKDGSVHTPKKTKSRSKEATHEEEVSPHHHEENTEIVEPAAPNAGEHARVAPDATGDVQSDPESTGDPENTRRSRFRARTNTIDEGDLRAVRMQRAANKSSHEEMETKPAALGDHAAAESHPSGTDTAESTSTTGGDGKKQRPGLQRSSRSFSNLQNQFSSSLQQFREQHHESRSSPSNTVTTPGSSHTDTEESPKSAPAAVPTSSDDSTAPRPRPRRGASQSSAMPSQGGGSASIGRVLVRQVPRNRGLPLKAVPVSEARQKAEQAELQRLASREKELAEREAADNAEVEAMLAWEKEISESAGSKSNRWDEMQKRKRKTISIDQHKAKASPTKLKKSDRTSSYGSSVPSSSSTSSAASSRPKKIAFRAAPAILYERDQNPRAKKFEETDSEDNIRFTDVNAETRIAAGTVEKLIQRLTYDKLTDTNFLSTFLLTYRSFMSPKELLDLLELRWNTAPPVGTTNIDGWKTNVLYLIRLRISNVLKSWIEKYFQTDFFGDEELLKRVDVFIDKISSSGLDRPAAQVRAVLDMRSEGKEKRAIEFSAATPRPRLSSIAGGKVDVHKLSVLDIDPLELARQLTSIEHRLFKAIEYKELLAARWTKKEKNSESPNTVKAIEFSEHVVNWVATSVLSVEDRKQRARVLGRFITIGKLLVKLNNFNGAFEILSGLRSLGVLRLKRTWNMLPSPVWAAFDELERLFDPDGNWKRYRETVETASPAVPYLNLFLSELLYVNDKHPDTLPLESGDSALINFEKMWLIADIINNIQVYQGISYNILPVPVVEDYINNAPTISALAQHEASLAREPEK